MKSSDILPDDVNSADINGVMVRKGTVAAFLYNAKVWSKTTSEAERSSAEQEIIEAIPALRALGLFEVLDVRDSSLRKLIDTNG